MAELQYHLEQERLESARDNLTEYAKYIDIPGAPVSDNEDCAEFYPDNVEPAEHHDLMMQALQAVAEGKIKRLMILMPPGSAKSTYASVVFPTWYMGKYAPKSIIKTTYGADLAKKFGRKCRQIVRSQKYKELFGTELSGDNAAVDDWSLTNGSTYMCGGILSGITGNRADGVITDDPFKGREDAESATIRSKTKEEYKSSLITRLKPKGFEIIINTRWHEDDLSGDILPDKYAGESGWITGRDGLEWYVLCLQAQCERKDDPLGRKIGEYLWTDWFPKEWWEQTKQRQGARNWASLYQQRPSPETGSFFLAEWIQWYDALPPYTRKYGASDYAVSDGDGDYTVHGVAAIDPEENIYICDWWRKQTSSDVWVDVFLDMVNRWKPMKWAEESGQIMKSLDPFINKRMQERQVWCVRQQYPSAHDKAMRAQSIRGRMAMKKVFFPRNEAWAVDLVAELLSFSGGGGGKYDDQVDVMSLFGRMLDSLAAGELPPPPVGDIAKPLTFNDLNILRRKNAEKRKGRI